MTLSEALEPQGAGAAPEPSAPPLPCPAPWEQQGAAAGAAAAWESRRDNGEWCPGDQSSLQLAVAGPPGGLQQPQEAEPPEGGWGWIVMLAAMWCNGAVFGIQNSCGVLFVSMLKEFGSQDNKQQMFKTETTSATRV